jgi:hypothetical protein
MQLAARPRITAGAKEVATQHWITAGVAVAGLLAVAPGVTPVVPHLQHELQAAAVRLTAGWDPLAAWQTAINTATKNATTLENNFLLAPGVGLQQAIVNEVGFLKEVINDPSSLQTVLTQIATNAQTVASGLTGVNESAATKTAATAHSVDTLHGLLASTLPTMLPAGTDVAAVTQVLNVLESPASGLLMGMVGPVISPGVALLNSALAIGAALQAKDPTTALSDLLNVPANVVGSFFNGADLNLDALVPLIAQAGILPAGTTINALDVGFGGLLSVGSVSQGTYTQGGTLTGTSAITTPGGSILNSIGLNISTVLGTTPITLNIPSQPVGTLGALESISQTAGVLLGDHWDGKKAVQTAPLSTLSDTATAKDAAVNPLSSLLSKLTVNSPVTDTATATATATAENASISTKLVGLPKLHVPVTAPRTVPPGTTGSVTAATDAAVTATGGVAVPVKGGSTSGKPTIANNPVRAAVANVSAGITKAVSGGTAKSGASAGSSSTGKSSGSSKGSGGGGRHRK